MDTQLKGKKALVSGSTAGIGFAVAKQLLQEGAIVFINGRTQKRVDQTVASLQSLVPGAQVEGVAADFSVVSDINRLLARIPDVDILVNNVGIFEPKEFSDIPDQDWLNMFEVNVLSGVRLARHYLPRMLSAGWGRVVFMSSESAINIPKEMIHYGMTKTAMLALSSGLAVLTKGTAVTVNAVLPGPTASEGVDTFMSNLAKAEHLSMSEMEERFFEVARPTSLIQRFATPDEVANLVTYVCSPLSSATNGASLRVDGGVVRSII
jgi:NAD(P)-dependent dehydrogenase (short-subunit alcohol dehydrogenase family)